MFINALEEYAKKFRQGLWKSSNVWDKMNVTTLQFATYEKLPPEFPATAHTPFMGYTPVITDPPWCSLCTLE